MANNPVTQNIVKLRVAEASQDDAYKGIARIDYDTMKILGLRRGDVVSVKGGRETLAIVDRAYPADVNEGIVRIDGIIRKNAKTGVGEMVELKKSDIKEAKKVTIAPVQENIVVQGDPEIFRRGLLGRAVIKGDIVVLGGVQRRKDLMSEELGEFGDIFGDILGGFGMNFAGFQQIKFLIVNTAPAQPVVITENTEVVVNSKAVEVSEDRVFDVTYEDVGGLTEEIKKVREMIELPLKHPEIFERLGVEPPKGVLLHGPPGTGKTLLAKAVANESDANFILLNGPEIMSKFYGESEKKIRDIFNEAEKTAPAIIFIDEIDAIAPKREDVQGEVERRVVSQLLTMMDGLKTRGKVVVIGATNRPNSLDPALRRPGRFDREVGINVPDKNGRLSILKIHTRNMPLTNDVKLEKLASITHGFVGADLSALTKEAAMSVLRGVLPKIEIRDDTEIPNDVLEKLVISEKDFLEALKVVRPSAMREVLVESPNINWRDVGGLDKVKQELIEAVEWPLQYADAFKRVGIRPPKGILLYGPPGTGKTLLAKAIANESEANFIQVKGPSLLSMWVGKSEEGVRKVFERARQVSPCIVFFDEMDALAPRRGVDTGSKVTERVLNQLLAEMDGLEELQNVVVIGATNRPDMIDPAILRPGRFDRILLVPGPDKEGILTILKIHTSKMPLAKDVDLESMASKLDGYVGADIENLAREAAMLALRENINVKQIKLKNFEDAMKKVKPSVTKSDMDKYQKIEETYLKSAKAALSNKTAYLG
ncbi:ATPase [Candidatus Pacearchaeota archaeon CG10_big_fil_rev_8_21_14_0_10_31_9]|nr:MAG: ATPase [Candidatus Pacearchaeota archaeon CG1_02_32_21]PIN96536.1 MAG: ATPase [Candidatus Pacearchaeota archaeon CG10_big_fil_rev_8_21_14_0_10_31_9]PIZ83684.1 MAG: ATPase [Candidatus Pacearchaeota archaeon CG_4_10_14_0_2_um_filter_05_32_18]